MLNKSEIIGGTLSIIAVFALLTGIYNIVIYQNVSNNLATGNLDNIADTTTATKTADTSTGTATAAITITPVSTDVITTNSPEECQRTLPFGISAGDIMDPPEEIFNCFNSCVLLNETLEQPFIAIDKGYGHVNFGDTEISMVIYGISSDNWNDGWSIYHRFVSSDKEKKAISCLVNNWNTVEAHVYTWNKGNEEEQVIQIIVASLGQSATYIIRIYSDSLPATDEPEPVLISYNDPVSGDTIKFWGNLTVDDVRGKRQIFDITYPVKEDENLTVVEEGKNCRIFC